MRVLVAAVGRLKAGAERDLCARYLARAAAAGRAVGLTDVSVHEIAESRARDATARRSAEAAALRLHIPPRARLIALDERGRNLSSAAFARDVQDARDTGVATYVLAIGGPDGLDPQLRADSDLVLALGALTWPHQLVRAMIAEQIYRAATILVGHPYHRT